MKKDRPEAGGSSNEETGVRLVRTTDAGLIARLNGPVQRLHHALYPTLFRPFDERDVGACMAVAMQDAQCYFMVCYVDEVAVGYVWYEAVERKENAFSYARNCVYIHQLAVDEGYRGRGIGRKLMGSAIVYAKGQSIKRIEVDYWARNNQAKEIYEHYGFTVEREIAFIAL